MNNLIDNICVFGFEFKLTQGNYLKVHNNLHRHFNGVFYGLYIHKSEEFFKRKLIR